MSRFRVPHTLVLLVGMCVLAYALTLVLPQGAYERATSDATGKDVVVPGSYQEIDAPERLPPWVVFTAIPRGLAEAQDIIFFIFLIGGFFGVFRATGAVDAGIASLLRTFGRRPSGLAGACIAMFALGSSTIGMAEEYVPFIPALIILCAGLRADALTAVAIVCVGYGVGYGAAAWNPFTVVVAQKLSGLAPYSGYAFRIAIFPLFLLIGIHHVVRYMNRVRADASKSLVADIAPPDVAPTNIEMELTTTHWTLVVLTLGGIAAAVYGISEFDWYLTEMSAIFLGLTVAVGIISRLSGNRIAETFCSGAAELTTTALLVGFARAIEVILSEGQVIDTVVHGISIPLEWLGAHTAAVAMFAVQTLCNVFIPSGSGQAAVTMPIMAPLADVVGIERQVAVLAYQFGDGFTNIVVPNERRADRHSHHGQGAVRPLASIRASTDDQALDRWIRPPRDRRRHRICIDSSPLYARRGPSPRSAFFSAGSSA